MSIISRFMFAVRGVTGVTAYFGNSIFSIHAQVQAEPPFMVIGLPSQITEQGLNSPGSTYRVIELYMTAPKNSSWEGLGTISDAIQNELNYYRVKQVEDGKQVYRDHWHHLKTEFGSTRDFWYCLQRWHVNSEFTF